MKKLFLILILLSGTAFGAKAKVDIDWRRQPEMALPKLSTAPTIDGTVNRAEWLTAAQLGPLKCGRPGVADNLRRDVFIGYDDTNLYIAFQLYRPASALTPRVPGKTGRVDSTGGGDFIEVMISPKLNFDKSFSFWLFANSAYGEATLSRGKDRNWNTDWQQKARVTKFGWEGEIAIPFAALGADGPPAKGETWGFDIIDNRKTPFKLLAHWSYRGNVWHTYENFGRIHFAGDIPAIRFNRAEEGGAGLIAVEFNLINTTADAKVQANLNILKRKAGADGGPKSYYENIESGISHDAQAEFTKGVNLLEMINFAMKFYEPVVDASIKRTVAVPSGQQRTVGLIRPATDGEYIASYEFTIGDKILARGVTPFIVEPPLAMRIRPYWLYSEVIDIDADLRKVNAPIPCTAIFTLHGEDTKAKPLVESRVELTKAGTVWAKSSLSSKGLKPAYYKVGVKLIDPKGKQISANVQVVKKPPVPPWYKNDHGNKIEVPEPWTPIEIKDKYTASVWARTYKLDTFFPSSIIVRDGEVLANPVALRMVVNGKEAAWKVKELKLLKAGKGKVSYHGVLENAVATLSGTLEFEYDGFAWYDLKLTPKQKGLKVDRMALAIDVQPKNAALQCTHKFLVDPVLSRKPPKRDLGKGSGPLVHSKSAFNPYTWIGDETRGIAFIAEAPVDWHLTKPNSAIETIPAANGKPAGIRAHMIDAPTVLEKPMRVQFALQATPIRKMPKHKNLNIFQKSGVFGGDKGFAQLKKKGCSTVSFYYAWRGNARTEMGGTPERPVDPKQQEKLKNAVKLAHKHGLKVIMFTGWGINAVSDNWKQFGYELGRYPIHNQGWGTFGQSAGLNGGYADFMAWGHHDLATEYGVDGVLWDSTGNLVQCKNIRTGNGWIDSEGRLRPSFAVRATREVYRRVYNIYKGEVRKDGVVYNHGGSVWSVNQFADILNRGEGRPMKAKTLRTSWVPFDEFRASYSGEPFGVLFSGENNDFKKLPMRVSTHLAVFLLHGNYPKEWSKHSLSKKNRSYDYNRRPITALWDIFKWLDFDVCEKYYYYQNQKVVTQTPESLLSSVFVNKDKQRALVCVSNLDKKPISAAKVRLDLNAMGLEGENVIIEDAYLRKRLIPADGALTLAIEPERYRLLKIWVEQPPQ
jgi:Glycoside hydrolase 123, N-terminal domain